MAELQKKSIRTIHVDKEQPVIPVVLLILTKEYVKQIEEKLSKYKKKSDYGEQKWEFSKNSNLSAMCSTAANLAVSTTSNVSAFIQQKTKNKNSLM